MEFKYSRPKELFTGSTTVLIQVFFYYAASCMNEDSAGVDFTEH